MDFNYKFIGNCNITDLKDKINQLTKQDWLEHQLRQNSFEAHKHTNTLEVLWDINSLSNNTIGKVHNNFFKLNIETFLNQIEPLYQSTYGDGYFIRILITKLKPNETGAAARTSTEDDQMEVKMIFGIYSKYRVHQSSGLEIQGVIGIKSA